MNEKGELLEQGRDRVRDRTLATFNARIDRVTRERLALLSDAPAEAVGRRMLDLDREWDLDRALMASFAIGGGLTFILGVRDAVRRGRWNGWLTVLSAQLGFLFAHALVGFSPPAMVLRGFGVRTQKEIDAERRELETALLDRPEAPQIS